MLMLLCSLAHALQMSAFTRKMFVHRRNIALAGEMSAFPRETLPDKLCSYEK